MAAGDDSAEGLVRIVFSDASETEQRVIMQMATFPLDVSTDPRQQPVLPMSGGSVGEDDKIIMQYKPLAGAGDVATDPTESATHTLVRIPVTIKNISTGNMFEDSLTSYNFNGTATNYTCAQNVWTTIGTYTVGAQERVKLGIAIPDNSRIMIDLLTAA